MSGGNSPDQHDDEIDIESLVGDADSGEPERVDGLLEGLLGADAADRDDVPSRSASDQEDLDERHPDDELEERESNSTAWACRHCEREFRDTVHEPPHHASCSDSRTHWRQLEIEAELLDDRAEDVVESEPDPDQIPVDEEQHSFLVDTAWHEFRAYLKFEKHGLSPYYALHSLMRRSDWHGEDLPSEIFEHNGKQYKAEFSYREKKSEDKQYKPWSVPEFKIERPREFHFIVRTSDQIRKASFHIRPRWPDIELQDGTNVSNPRDMIGVDVDVEGSNHEPEEYPELLDKTMQAFGVNGGSPDPERRYLSTPNVEPWSVVIDGERYVRLDPEYSGRLIGVKGPIERIGILLANERSGYRKRVADDTKIEGYYHTATVGSMRAAKLLDGHRLGKEIKHYHVQHPGALDESDPLKNPKLGSSYQRSISDTTVYWDIDALEDDSLADPDAIGLEDMSIELDEVVLNTLRWADLPTRPDKQVFVADSVFKPVVNRRDRRLVPDPLPTLAKEQDHMVVRAVSSMADIDQYDTDPQVLDELLADGGSHSPKSLAKSTGKAYETILRSIKRLSDIIDHQYGNVELKSRYIAQSVAERAGRLLEDFGRVQEGIDRIGQDAAAIVKGLGMEDSPFEMWAREYLEGIDDLDEEPHILLRMGYRPADSHEYQTILQEGLTALRMTIGGRKADASRIVRFGKVRANLQDGKSLYSPFTA